MELPQETILTLAKLGKAYVCHMLAEHNEIAWLGDLPTDAEIKESLNDMGNLHL